MDGKRCGVKFDLRERELAASQPGPVTIRYCCPLCQGEHPKSECPELPESERQATGSTVSPMFVKQREVARLKDEGVPVKDIAAQLGISPSTVRVYNHNYRSRHQFAPR